MAEQVKEDNQKTIVSFIVGLLIGGLLVWAFSGDANGKPTDKSKEDTKEESKDATKTEDTKTDDTKVTTPAAATLPVGDAAVSVGSQIGAGPSVAIDSATFPTKEGWVGVRDYSDGKLGGLLGVARFSAEQGLVPKEIPLMRATTAGKQYAIVFYSESGDRKFSLADDVQMPKEFATFTAK